MNKLAQPQLSQIVTIFPNLFCLDYSFNDLCDLEGAINKLKVLKSLRMLSLEGNPLVFTKYYKEILTERVPTLKILDGNVVIPEEPGKEDKKDEKKAIEKTMNATGMSGIFRGPNGKSVPGTPIDDHKYKFESNATLDFDIKVLRNVEGSRYLVPEENCSLEADKLEELADEYKSS